MNVIFAGADQSVTTGVVGSTCRALVSAFVLLAALGCDDDRRNPPPSTDVGVGVDPRPNVITGGCAEGEVRDCSITLSQHEGVLNCYRGQQVCNESVWGTCGSGEVTSLPAPALPGAAPGSRLLAITGASTCVSNPCDPYCLEVEAEDGTGTSDLSSDLSDYEWQTGTLSTFPSGLVKKGLTEPCSTGSDCQYNTYCQYPVSTGCGHDKCTAGGALESTCDSCVEDICAVEPGCCVDTPTTDSTCTHDPCMEGAALNAACDPCVTAICLDTPSCCTGSWDAACAAKVVTVCGAVCSCLAGELEYNGTCYYKEEADDSWTDSRVACQERGAGWDLLSVNDAAENNFVVSDVIDDSETWIGFTDGNSIGTNGNWKWASGAPSGTWAESATALLGLATVINYGSAWSYNATNVDPGATWTQIGFNAASWPSGNAELGFGEGDEDTTFSLNGPSYYFRRIVNLPKVPIDATLNVLYDDGFVAYVNGTEVLRENVTNAAHTSYANTSADNDLSSADISVSPFVAGNNVIAVVVKNRNNTSTDLSFDLKLDVTYGPDRVISYGDDWSYYAAAASPDASWAEPDFDDTSWSSGPAELGFGEGDEATTFPKTGASYYFRRTVTLAETVSNASLSVLYDDGFVAYVNGVEVSRDNVTATGHTSYASATADNAVQTDAISTDPFVVGENVIAVMIKNGSSGSTDLSFDAQLDVTLSGSSIYENFPSGEPDAEACAIYSANRVGTWADKKCNQNTDSVCEGPPKQMTGGGGVPLSGSWTAVDYGSSWSYRNTGVDPGSGWIGAAYDDSAWSSGPGQLGYGDGDEGTSFAVANPTYYFRRTLNVGTDISDATLSMVYDDGFVAYVNGVEVLRRNVTNTSHSAYASAASGDNEALTVAIDTAPFVQGANTIAVMVKNSSASSGDVSFDLKLQVTLCGLGGCPPDPQWSQSCIDKVGTVCDAKCDTQTPTRTTGQCVSWFPGETDPGCAGIDLSVGVPCDDNIPVCNHGTTTAPAGLRVVHFPANSQQYQECSPNLAHPQMKECLTTSPIPPGECVNVTGCPGLTGNREIMVNPAGASYVAECSCRDNWSLYNAGECGVPTCDGGSSIATLQKTPVDIIFVIDNSGSMQGEIAQVQQRINEDFADIIESSGVDYRVIMMSRYGDIDTAVGGSDYPICVSSPLGGHDCSNPISQGVAHNPPHFYHFSTDVGSLDGLCRIIQGFSNKDELTTITRPWTPVAPTGYQSLLRANARKAFVVITDDRVNCSYGGYTFNDLNTVAGGQSVATAFDNALLTLSPAQFGTAANRNYVFHSIVAMTEFVPGTQPWPASEPIKTGKCTPGAENPGTGYQGLSVLTGGLRYPTCRNDDFNAIFQAVAEEVIEGASVSCTVALESNDGADPDQTTVRFVPTGSVIPTTFSRVANAAACVSNAYYYSDTTTITLCPTTCAMVQADLQGSLGVEVGCSGGGYTARVMNETYESECNESSRVQWGFFTYNTSTPGDSNAQFRIRTAETEAGLASAAWTNMATAQAAPDTQVCSFSGPAPCPIDLYTVLGETAAHHRFAEVEVVLNPTSDGALPSSVQGWQLNYSCPFTQ